MFETSKRNTDIFNGSKLPEKAFMELQIKTSNHIAAWHLDVANWSLDQSTGEIIFRVPKFGIQAKAPAQIIGSYNAIESSWLWAHINSSIDKKLTANSLELYDFCIKSKFRISGKMKIDEMTAWKLASLSCMHNNAQGIYRGPAGNTMVFIEFGKLSLSSTL